MAKRKKTLTQIRRDDLHRHGVSYDYREPFVSAQKGYGQAHCRWTCYEPPCQARAFKSYPAFRQHLKKAHGIDIDQMRMDEIAADQRRFREELNKEPDWIEREHFEKMGYKWIKGKGWVARP